MYLIIYRKENQDLLFRFVQHYPFTRQIGEVNSSGWIYLGCQSLGSDFRFHSGQFFQEEKGPSKLSQIIKIIRS